jgi:hypothetical protein
MYLAIICNNTRTKMGCKNKKILKEIVFRDYNKVVRV